MRNAILTLVAIGLLGSFTTGCTAKIKKARHISRGDKFYNAGQYAMAEIEYLNVLKVDSANQHAFARLGLIYYDEGRPSRAFAFLKKAAELNTNDMNLQLKLGNIYLALGTANEAHQKATLVLSKIRTNSEAPVLLAESVTNQAQADLVRANLEKLSSQIGDTAPLQLAYGALFVRERNLPAAEAAYRRAQTLDPKSSAAHFGLGMLCLAQKDLKGAEPELKAAADLAPMRSVRRIKFADFKIQSGQVEEGKRILSEISKAAPDYLPAWIRQAEVALAEKNYTNCASLLDQALNRDASSFDALLLHGRLMLAQRDASKAIAEFDHLSTTELFTRSPQVHYFLAVAHLLNTNDTTRAFKSLNQAIYYNSNYADAILLKAQLEINRDEPSAAITELSDLLKQQPELPSAYFGLAAAYTAKGQLDQALAAYRHIEQLFPKNPEMPMRMGLIYLQQNKNGEARQAFTKTLELATNYLPAVEKLMDLDIADGKFDEAMARVDKAGQNNSAELNLLAAKVHLARANAQLVEEAKKDKISNSAELLASLPAARSEMDKAQAAIEKAIELKPDFQDAYILLARLYVDTKKNQKALDELNAALARNPRDVGALMLMATIQNEAKDFSAARATYENLLTINPAFFSALNNLAYLYSEKFGELDKAYEMARKARDLLSYKAQTREAPGQSKIRDASEYLKAFSTDTLGWIVFKRREYPYAVRLLQESAEKLSSEPEVQFHLAMAYYMVGREEPAKNAFTHALGLKKDFVGIDEAKRHLAILEIDARTADTGAQETLEKQLRSQPGDPGALARLAGIYERDGARDKVLKVYEAALQENPKNVPVMLKVAQLSAARGDSRCSLELTKDAYKLAPEDPDIALTLGRLVFKDGDHKWALSLLQQSARQNASDPELLYDLGLAYYSVGQVAEAEANVRQAAQAPSFSRVADAKRFLELAPVSLTPEKALTFESQARESLKANSDDVPALAITAFSAEQRDDLRAARQDFERILNRYPNFAPAWKHLANLYAALDESQKSYEMATKAREALPNDAEVAKSLGIALYVRNKDYRNSARLLDEGVRKGSEDAKSMYYLGLARYQLKEGPASKKALEKALALNIEPKLADDARRILAELK
jgi:tetratricopeptide (TPR) repeat protein